jgi:hypothetical protein
MTLKQFLRKLRRTPRNWRLENGRYLRSGGGGTHCHCPISAVIRAKTGDVELARRAFFNPGALGVSKLHLRESVANNIATAAGTRGECGYLSAYLKGLRHRLKAACGLIEK